MSMYDSSKFFKTYFANAEEKSVLIDLMQSRFFPPSHTLNILDLGCHDGALITKLLHTYAHRMPSQITLTGVEPSRDAALEHEKSKFPFPVQATTIVDTAERYFLKKEAHEYFDWVIASQCLYWSEDLPYIVKNIAECSDAGLIVLRGQQGIYEIQSQFKNYIGNPKEQFYTAQDIEDALVTQNIPFEKHVTTTMIHLPPQGSMEMSWLIAFFLQWGEQKMDNEVILEVESWIFAKAQSAEKMAHEVCFFWLGQAMVERRS